MASFSLRSFIKEVITETITKPVDRLKELKGKVVESVEANNQQVVIKFDDGSSFVINTTSLNDPIEYHLERGMLKPQAEDSIGIGPNGSGGGTGGGGPTTGTQV